MSVTSSRLVIEFIATLGGDQTMRILMLLSGLVLITATGCNTVTLTKPLGKPLSAEFEQSLSGVWLTVPDKAAQDRSAVYIKRSKPGMLVVGMMEWDAQTEQYVCHNMETIATEVAGVKLLNTRDKEHQEAADARYTLWRFEQPAPDQLEVYIVDAEPFRAAIEAGQLQGEIVRHEDKFGKTFEVQCEPDALAKYLETADARQLVEMKNPLKLQRISTGTQ
jgi:hypothetical protein